MTSIIKGSALVALACLAAACNPFEIVGPDSRVPNGVVATDELCIPDPETGTCPRKDPDDITRR